MSISSFAGSVLINAAHAVLVDARSASGSDCCAQRISCTGDVRKTPASHRMKAMQPCIHAQERSPFPCSMPSGGAGRAFSCERHDWHAACFELHHKAHDGLFGNAAGSSLSSAAAEGTGRGPAVFFSDLLQGEREHM
jgi:hypothetical protein